MSTGTTTNKGLITVTVGSELDTWGPFVNANAAILDNNLGGVATVALTNVPVVLSSAQYSCNFLTFTGAITANVTVTLPPIGSFYVAQNLTSNTSNFNITLTTTTATGQHIGLPWGEAVDIMVDGSNVKFRNFGRVGAYVDIGSSIVPSWITACTVPPYLICDGTTFNSSTYPTLTMLLGGTTLPDLRGRTRFMYDPLAVAGTACTSFLFAGGDQGTILHSSNLGYVVASHPGSFGAGSVYSVQSVAGTPASNMPPAIAAGITVIRAA